MAGNAQKHWDTIFTTKPEKAVSWFQETPTTSMRLIHACRLSPAATILDVGAGASRLPDALLEEGFEHIILLDISPAALAMTKARLGHKADNIRFIAADIAAWTPDVTIDLWHDRATLHFLTEQADRSAYGNAVRQAVRQGGYVIISGFAPTGPERCSGLPVTRADQGAIADLLGPDFVLLEAFEETHVTPSGTSQRFLFTRFQRRTGSPSPKMP